MDELDSFEQLAEQRRQTTSQMMWQVPALSIAAQAFLYTRAFDPNTSNAARIVVSVAALISAFATLQLLLKHRYHEEMYSVALDQNRASRGAERLHLLFPQAAGASDEDRFGRWESRPWLRCLVVNRSSVIVWAWTLWAFVLIDFFAIADAAFGWNLF